MTDPALTVWCASYPKSGNTWVRALFSGALGDGRVHLHSLAGHQVGNDQRAIFGEFGLSPTALDDRLATELMVEVGSSLAMRNTEPVFRKTHNAFTTPGAKTSSHSLRTPTKAIYIVRDPRGVAVSMAHHMSFSQAEAVTVMANGPAVNRAKAAGDRYLTRGCRVAFDWGSWSDNISSWLDQDELPVTLVRYEDLAIETERTLAELIEWLGLDVPPERLRMAVQESSFENLSVQELIEGFAEASGPDRQFFRRGQAESWREELEPGLEAQIIADHGPTMERLGYGF